MENEDWKINNLQGFHYVYILVSEADETRHYTGLTENIESRLKAHNGGQVPHTAKYRPWKIEISIYFENDHKAEKFEKYLKSGSGHAFSKRHFW